jgi:hypothetical protein
MTVRFACMILERLGFPFQGDISKRKYISSIGGNELWPGGIIPWDFSASRNFCKFAHTTYKYDVQNQ